LLSGLRFAGLFDYGWHYDEGGSFANFGARDQNIPDDAGETATLWAKTTVDPYFPVRFKLQQLDDCAMRASMEFFDGVTVHAIPHTEIHYLHLANRPSGTTYTGWADEPDELISANLGTLALCDTSFYHLHQSAELDPHYYPDPEIDRIGQQGDTCWTDANPETWQCPDNNYRVHATCSSWSGTGGLSGNVSQYICEEWSREDRDPKNGTFLVTW
jgi:hypothetical protein